MSSRPPVIPGTSAFDQLLQQADGQSVSDSAEGQHVMRAGTEIERGEIQQWARRLGRSYTTIPRARFPAWLRQVFPGQARPDMVAINPRRRTLLVGDVTAQPNADHLQKTVDYARQLAANLPPQYRGWRVLAQERYWGLSPERRRELGIRGTSNVSRRIVVQREAEALFEATGAPQAAAAERELEFLLRRVDRTVATARQEAMIGWPWKRRKQGPFRRRIDEVRARLASARRGLQINQRRLQEAVSRGADYETLRRLTDAVDRSRRAVARWEWELSRIRRGMA